MDETSIDESSEILLDAADAETAMQWLQGIGTGAAQGAATGMVGGPWGALIGGLAGAGLGALQTAQQQQQPQRPRAVSRTPRSSPSTAAPVAAPVAAVAPADPVAAVPSSPSPVAATTAPVPPAPAPAPAVTSRPAVGLADIERLLPLFMRLASSFASAVPPRPADRAPQTARPTAVASSPVPTEDWGGLLYHEHLKPTGWDEHHPVAVAPVTVASPVVPEPNRDTLDDAEAASEWLGDFVVECESSWA